MPVVDIHGVELNYRELGTKGRPTIVFSHPVLFDSTVFEPLVSELKDDFHLLLVDIHGHGKSGVRKPVTLDDMVADYHQLLTILGISSFSWVGYSIGGMLGMRLALAHPQTVDSLVLMATTARLDPPPIRETVWPLWEMFRDGHREDIVDAALQFFFAPSTFRDQPQLVARYRNMVNNYTREQGERIFQVVRAVFDRTDINAQIGAITVPTLAIGGKEDPGTPPEELEVIASRIPNARLAIIEETSHLLLVEKPQHVVPIVREFLQKRSAVGKGVGGDVNRRRTLAFDGPAGPFFGVRWEVPLEDQEFGSHALPRVRR